MRVVDIADCCAISTAERVHDGQVSRPSFFGVKGLATRDYCFGVALFTFAINGSHFGAQNVSSLYSAITTAMQPPSATLTVHSLW